MLTSTGHAATDSAARYTKQLAAHLGRRLQVTETDEGPLLTFVGAGTALLSTDGNGVLARVEAVDEAALDRIEDVVGRHLERFGQRHELTMIWDRTGPAAEPGAEG